MARSLTPRKKKTVRTTKDETYMINLKYLGDEPKFNGVVKSIELMSAFNWYNYMCNVKEAREYLTEYLKNNNKNEEIKTLKRVPDAWIPTSAAWLCRMIARGGEIEQKQLDYIEFKIKFSLGKAHEQVVEKKKTNTVSIQDRIKEKTDELLADIEQIVDEREKEPNFSLYEWLKGKEIPASYMPAIIKRYRDWLNELLDAYEGSDPDLNEGYRNFTKQQLSFDIVFFNMIIDDAQKYADVTKKTRKPRKPRAVSVEKKIKHLKYQKEDKTFKIASVDPEKIIGCQELWTFNTKYKTLTVLRALDRGGLQVKGTSITNYDENTSMTKRTGRKAEYFVDRILKGGKIVLRKVMEEEGIGSEANLAYRINENTILLKVS